MTIKPKIIFYTVTSNQSKISCICSLVQQCFALKQPILITAPGDDAAKYMDQLLWRHPEESFVPHLIANEKTNELVVITTANANVNNASHLLNLCSTISPVAEQFKVVYELFDETSAEKLRLSQERKQAYEQAGFPVQQET